MPDDLYMVKSDQGDGGWSIHSKSQEDDDGIAPVLARGFAPRNEQDTDYVWPLVSDAAATINQ